MSDKQTAEKVGICPFCKGDPEALADAHGEGWRAGRDEGRRNAQEDALAIVKRACDIECKSPGKHTGCSSHEPYRVLRDALYPPGSPTTDGPQR